MKIKQTPEDFVVREQSAWTPDGGGPFAVYRMTKRGVGTLEAVDLLSRTLKISRNQVSFGGLKDRHSASEQMISIRRGPPKAVEFNTFKLEYLGQSARPFDRTTFSGNQFTITIRDLTADEARTVRQRLDEIRANGVPNYYDDQRFGSLRGTTEFIARRLIARDFEGALKLAIATPSAEDQKRERAIKKTIQARWGDWAACKNELQQSSERSIVTYLVDHPDRFAAAIDLLNPQLRILYFSAYQSFLWNSCLSALLARTCPREALFPYPFVAGELFLYRSLPEVALKSLSTRIIPLLTPTTAFDDPAMRAIVDELLAKQGITQRDLRIKGLKTGFFSKGQRAALLMPGDLSLSEPAADELNRDKHKLTMTFGLPRGSYATILIKRLTYDMETGRREARRL